MWFELVYVVDIWCVANDWGLTGTSLRTEEKRPKGLCPPTKVCNDEEDAHEGRQREAGREDFSGLVERFTQILVLYN